jgi:hypothetical protein
MSFLINAPAAPEAAVFHTAIGPFVAKADNDVSGHTVVAKYSPRILRAGGIGVRLTLQGLVAPGHATTIANVTIGLAANAAGAKPWDTNAPPTAVTFDGSDAVVLTRGSLRLSDPIPFVVDRSRGILIAYNVDSGGFMSVASGLNSSYHIIYTKAPTAEEGTTAEAGTQSKSPGYTAYAGASPYLRTLECYS